MHRLLAFGLACILMFGAAGEAYGREDPAFLNEKAADQSGRHEKTLSELREQYSDWFIMSGNRSVKKVALTFDDGPDAVYTPQVLDVLRRCKVKATFFLVGHRAEKHPDVVRRIVREGHAVGNHSYNHPYFPKLSPADFAGQIERTEEVLASIAGYRPKLIRPPYGAINEEQLQWAGARRFVVVNWNVDSLDWKELTPEMILQNIVSATRPGSIVLLHSAGGTGQNLSGTVRSLPAVIAKLREAGYELVTVPELLQISEKR